MGPSTCDGTHSCLMVQQCDICITDVLSYTKNGIKVGTGLKAPILILSVSPDYLMLRAQSKPRALECYFGTIH